MRLLAGGARLLGVFLDPAEAALTRAWWDWLALTGPGRGSGADAARLSDALRTGPVGGDAAPARQFVERVEALRGAQTRIDAEEAALNARLFDLYALTPRERRLVLAG